MTIETYNCIICAEEVNAEKIDTASTISGSMFKICQACLDKSDPSDDYNQARSIVSLYLKNSEIKNLFKEAHNILESIKK